MINNVVITGRLTKDPELKYTPSGIAVLRCIVAVPRTFSGANGEKQTDFVNCTIWRKQAENTANFTNKGSLIGVVGRIETGSYDGQDGKKVYTTTVVAESVQFLESKKQAEQRNSNSGGYNEPPARGDDPFRSGSGPIDVSDDDLPF